MRHIRLLSIMPLAFLFISCTKPIYTSFKTYTAKSYSYTKIDAYQFYLNKQPQKELEEILKNKGLIDYKMQFYKNNYKLQIKQYKIVRVANEKTQPLITNTSNDTSIYPRSNKDMFYIDFDGKNFRINIHKKSQLVITNLKDNTNLYIPFSRNDMFNISFDGQYLGVCDRKKLRIFDLNNNLSLLESYKDKKCTEVYFSLDNKYLAINNKNNGQIYDFKNANLVYDNPKKPISIWRPSYAVAGNEIIMLDEAKRIIVEGIEVLGKRAESIIFFQKDKELMQVVVYRSIKATWIPFIAIPPTFLVKELIVD